MTKEEKQEVIFEITDELHKRFGICAHCGKKKCLGKQSMSRLPLRISVDDLFSVFAHVVESERLQ